MVILFDKKSDCSGCTACMHICPQNAIFMCPDEEGFLYPKINSESCIECGLCKRVCVFQNPEVANFSFAPIAVYAMKNADERMRLKSQSGGFSNVAASAMIEKNGVVFGAGYDDKMVVCHKAFESIESLPEMQGSKYVQSQLSEIFNCVKNSLRDGRRVLFTGTPCQVAGLNSFLHNYPLKDNLITLDIVCHGVPSPMVFKDFLSYSEKKYRGKITNFVFRDKKFGWHSSVQTFSINKNKIKEIIYSTLFYSEIFSRPSCHFCIYTKPQRVADITMGDFWGVEKCMPEFDDNKGISLVLLNTLKGQSFFDSLKDKMILRLVETEDFLQAQLRHPPVVSPIRERAWKEYRSYGFPYIARNYGGDNLKNKLKTVIVRIVRRSVLYSIIKKVVTFFRGS